MQPQNSHATRPTADFVSSLPAPAVLRIWPESLLRIPCFPCLAFRSNQSCKALIRSCPPPKCPAEFQSAHSRLGMQAQKTPPCSQLPLSPLAIRRCAENWKHIASSNPRAFSPRNCRSEDGNFNRPQRGG